MHFSPSKIHKRTCCEEVYNIDTNTLRTNKNTPGNPKRVGEAYEELSKTLNVMGGPSRTPAAWKKVR